MFAKSVIKPDVFLDLPATARLQYFDLGMKGGVNGIYEQNATLNPPERWRGD